MAKKTTKKIKSVKVELFAKDVKKLQEIADGIGLQIKNVISKILSSKPKKLKKSENKI